MIFKAVVRKVDRKVLSAPVEYLFNTNRIGELIADGSESVIKYTKNHLAAQESAHEYKLAIPVSTVIGFWGGGDDTVLQFNTLKKKTRGGVSPFVKTVHLEVSKISFGWSDPSDPNKTWIEVYGNAFNKVAYQIDKPMSYFDSIASTQSSESNSVDDFGITGTYFVSSSTGSDANNGLSPATAKATLAGVTALNPAAGSKVALKAGDTFREMLTTPTAGTAGNYITYGAYGVGKKPIISGCNLVTGWTQYYGSIYRASLSTRPYQVFVNGTFVNPARMPKSGYYPITANSGSTLTSTSLTSGFDYTGAIVIAKNTLYTQALFTVSSSSAQTLTLSASSPSTGYGFILQNRLEFLTQANEWYYDATGQYLYVWLPDGTNPAYSTMEASVRDYCITLNKAYQRFENIETFGANKYGIEVSGASPIFSKCTVDYSARAGIHFAAGDYPLIDGCTISNAGSLGIFCWQINPIITNNTITNIGLNSLWNGQHWANYSGIGTSIHTASSTAANFSYNTVKNTGYNGITCNATGSQVHHNYFENCLSDAGDGGAIYTWRTSSSGTPSNAGSRFYSNVIRNCRGDNSGTTASYRITCGVYLDQYSTSVEVDNNVIINCNLGIHANSNSTGSNVHANKIIDCGLGVNATSCDATNSFTYNEFTLFNNNNSNAPWWNNQPQAFVVSYSSLATFNYNIYNTLYQTSQLFWDYSTMASRGTFAAWKAARAQDASATLNSSYTGTEEVYYNSTSAPVVYQLTGAHTDLSGTSISSFTLQPFTGRVVVKQ